MRSLVVAMALLLALGAGPGLAQKTGETDGTADVLNGFVLKEIEQCRPLPPLERRQCCEKLLHPNACTE